MAATTTPLSMRHRMVAAEVSIRVVVVLAVDSTATVAVASDADTTTTVVATPIAIVPSASAVGAWGILPSSAKRFDVSYTGEERTAAATVSSYGIDTNWYADSGATDHITGDLDKLTVREKYHGADQIHTTSGAGMNINHIGDAFLRTPTRDLQLKNVLQVPQSNKNLISVHRFTSHNHVFLELHPSFFLIKDQATKATLLRGRARGGLYLPSPLFPLTQVNKCVQPPSLLHRGGIIVSAIRLFQ